MKKYLINGKFLSQRVTGVQRFAIEVLKALDEVAEEGQFILLVPATIRIEFELKKIKVLALKHNSSGAIWTQVIIPYVAVCERAIPLTFSGIYPLLYPGVTTIHDITPMRHKESFRKRFYLSYDFIYRLSIRRLKHIFTISEFSKKEISDYYHVSENKISVVYSASNLLGHSKEKSDVLGKNKLIRGQYILSVGSLHVHKNPEFMFRLATKYPNQVFVVVGGTTGITFEPIEKKRISNLVYTGYLTDDELVEIYNNAKGFVFPSLYEGFGIPALEAIQAGVKHIAVSDIPVFREVYDIGVYVFDPLDVEKFDMDKFLSIEITDEQRKTYMRKYSWSNSARRILNEL